MKPNIIKLRSLKPECKNATTLRSKTKKGQVHGA